MKNITKILTTAIFILFLIFSILAMIFLDWHNNWYFLFYLFLFLILYTFATINIENTFLFIIFIMPTAMYFNDFKLLAVSTLPFLQAYDLPLNPVTVMLFLIILLGLITTISEWEKIKTLPLKYIFLFYLLYIIASTFWSNYKNLSLRGLGYFLAFLSCYIIAYCYFSNKQKIIKIILAVIASSLVPLIISIYQISAKQYFFEPISNLNRLQGPFEHPNLFASYLFVVISLYFAYYFSKKNQNIFQNKLFVFYSSILLIALVLTYSRSAWSTLVLFIIIFSLLKRKIIAILTALSPIIFLIISSINILKMRILSVFKNSIFNSIIARKNIWKAAWQAIKKKPVLGYGTGSSEAVIESAKVWPGGSSLPHNDFILYALESGIFGLIFFMSYTLGFIYNTFTIFKSLPSEYSEIKIFNFNLKINFKILSFGILAILLSMILSSFFDSNSRRIITQIITWSILGSLFNLKKEKTLP